MNKKELIARVKENCEITSSDAEKYVNEVFNVITEALAEGETVVVTGFGKFEVKEKAARTGRNPATGETIQIAAKTVPNFKAEKKLKDAVAK
jgi:DNA-binding protein HU-beta